MFPSQIKSVAYFIILFFCEDLPSVAYKRVAYKRYTSVTHYLKQLGSIKQLNN